MKKLGKLEINPGKLMKNEELILLRGGYSTFECNVDCDGYHEAAFAFSATCDPYDVMTAMDQCASFFGTQFTGCSCWCWDI